MKNTRSAFKNQQGFNLIELMIVIAIIALLIGVGVPAWQSMVRSGNETTAIQSMTTIRTCQTSYAGKHQGKFAPGFDELAKSDCIDGNKFKGTEPVVNGYIYKMTAEEPSGRTPAKYTLTVEPQVSSGVTATGNRYFFFNSTLGAIKSSEEGPATEESPSI